MNLSDVIDKVLVKMDELTPFGTGLVNSSSVNPIRDYIRDSINAGWKSLISRSPVHILPVNNIPASISIKDDLSIVIETDRFSRAIAMKMTSWNNEVRNFTTLESRTYQEQMNKHTRGSIYKPVVVVVSDKELLAFSAESVSDTKEYFKGVGFLNLDDIQIPSSLLDAFCFEVAGIVYTILEQPQQAEIMFATATKLLL